MYRSRAVEDPVRRWHRFNRAGWRMALGAGGLWLLLGMLLLGIAPAPESLPRETPPRVAWWPLGGPPGRPDGAVVDLRMLWSPSVFALPTPAGFSHSLRRGRARLTPPVQTVRPEAAYLPPDPLGAAAVMDAAPLRLKAAAEPGRPDWAASVFPPRLPEPGTARMGFPPGWESRLFSGVALDFGAWTGQAWTARMEMRFDGGGVPQSMLLVHSSGLPEVDRRLVRAARGWRLLEPEAPRSGIVVWSSPAAPPAAGAASAPVAGGRVP
jgi:hypothetical protein